jgi:hypothetical protein
MVVDGTQGSKKQPKASAGTSADAGSSSSGGSSKQSPAAAGVAAHASSSSSSSSSKQQAGKTLQDSWSLQFDDCALIVQHYINKGPVLKAIADWAAAAPCPTSDARIRDLLTVLKTHFTEEVAAESGSKKSRRSSSSKVVSDGPRRRTLVPPMAPRGVLSLDAFITQVDGRIDAFFQSEATSRLTADLQATAVQLVYIAAVQVAQEMKLQEGSAALEAHLQTAMFTGERDC